MARLGGSAQLGDRLRRATVSGSVPLLAAIGATLLWVPPAGASADHVPHRVVVKFTAAASDADRSELRDELGVLGAEGLGGGRTVVYRTAEDVSVPEALRSARSSGAVEFAEPDLVYKAGLLPDDPYFQFQWGLQNTGLEQGGSTGTPGSDIGAVRAWDVSTGSSSTVLAVVDSGIDYSHEDLAPQIATDPGETGGGRESNGVDDDGDGYVDNWRGWDFAEDDDDATDTDGHGTAMSGVAAAAPDNGLGITGSAWDARILPVRVGVDSDFFPNSSIAAGIRYAGSHGAEVVNISIYGPYSAAIEDAIDSYPNVLFLACAGNEGSSVPRFPCALDSPNLLCLAATDNQDTLTSFSNYGPHVDLAAPGLVVTQTTLSAFGYGSGAGTSQATAITSGAAALMRSHLPSWTALEIRQRILETVDPIAGLQNAVASGGRLDVGNALDFVSPETTIDTAPPALTDDPAPSLGFSSNEEGASFECRVDGGAWKQCSSETPLKPLPDGLHEFAVRAIDGGGNVDSSPATVSFTVDAPGPTTSIDSGPATFASTGSASFTYSSDGVAFECSLDGGLFAGCPPNGVSYAGLEEGPHFFSVRAQDGAGIWEPAPPTYAWAVDLAPPETTIDRGPPPLSSATSARFEYSSEPYAGFECRLDAAGFSPCGGSGRTFTGLGHGTHTFAVRAVDLAGNLDESPAVREFEVDVAGPSVRIDSGPPRESERTSAQFTYSSAEPGVTFECALDGKAPADCGAGGVSYERLTLGEHSFTVRGIDALGNVGAPAPGYPFAVRAPAPPPQSQGSPAKALPATALLRKAPRSSARRRVVFFLGGGSSYRYRIDEGPWRATGEPRLILHVRPGPHLLTVVAVDSAGADPTPVAYRFRTLGGRLR